MKNWFGQRKNSKVRRLRVEHLETRKLLASLPYGATESDLGEFLLGSVAVTPVFIESNGAIDPSTEDWTQEHINEVLEKIDVGLDWWVDTLATQSTIHELSFNIDTTYAATPASSSYEPIGNRSNEYDLFVSEFLSNQGFGTGNLETDIRAFNQSQREKLGTDWSFTMFVVPSLNDSDGQFAAGSSFSRAFAFAGGLFMVVPSTRPASTFTHETGHIFWARDEYAGGGSYFSRRGYYNTQNTNAADNPTPGFVQQPSIMASGTLLETAYDGNLSPASTLAMLGWQDSDGDQIFDVLDVPHRLTGSGYFDPTDGKYYFNGNAVVQTLPNLNSSGLQNDITINRIREIQYRFDGGTWQTASAPDAYEALVELSVDVPTGATEIEIRALDTRTTVESNIFSGRLSRADGTLVPGINGSVWIDANENDLRDVGEFGQSGWNVELVDASGNLVDLRANVEPDDYENGVLTSGFRNDVLLRGVGSDSDGRVAVFDDANASTGSKVFYTFSKGTQSFSSQWSDSSRRLQIDFPTPETTVSIDAIGAFNGAIGRLEAYDIGGNLLDRYTTGSLDAGQVERMTVERGQGDIAYVIASGHAFTSVRLDNLTFGPETTTTTSDLGLFSLPLIPEGDYFVQVTSAAGFRATAPTNGRLPANVTAGAATADIDFAFVDSISPWQNPTNSNDVNGDELVSPIDVLLIVNEINAGGARNLAGSGIPTNPFIDVSGDTILSALDALLVINFINANGAGEGEESSLVTPTHAPSESEIYGPVPLSAPEASFNPELSPTAPPPEQSFWGLSEEEEENLLNLLSTEYSR